MTMKRTLLAGLIIGLAVCDLRAATTIDAVNRYAWGGNIGWINWAGDNTNGAVIGNYVCSGYIYSANTGWINLGSGAPANGIRYQNAAANDFGVNQDGLGNLSGYAWGANIGWILFTNTGAPAVNLRTGQFNGYAWSANCGWISLSNVFAYVQTDTLYPGPLSTNGLPVPWLLTYFGTTNVNPNADLNGTGMTVYDDYIAGLDPTNPANKLQITAKTFAAGGTNASLTWSSVPTRLYYILKTTSLTTPNWVDSGLGEISPSPGSTTTMGFGENNAAMRFFRVQAVLPLAP
jgi:hypothetical protein